MNNDMDKINKARKFCEEVRNLALKYDLPFFVVTDGASATNNNGCEAVRNARENQIKWELENNFDPNEDWSKSKKNDLLYRVTYNGEGIYNALKKKIGLDTWNKLLLSNNINWLPKPPTYCSNNKSYFTKEGYEKFISKSLPLICEYLDKDKIIVEESYIDDTILYQDEYQVVITKK
jgi:hypothetical protein